MYSVVLVMALAGSAEAPECHGNQGACGCQGMNQGCFGGGCAGIRNGCGGGCFGGCAGIRQGCCLTALCGCFGGRNGCFGGCGGGCYGGGYGGCGGYANGCVGGCQGGAVVVPPAQTMPAVPQKDPIKKDQTILAAPATILVTLPAEARLSVDGHATKQSSGVRQLVTPALPRGQEFTYTLVAEMTQDGQPVLQSQSVTVRAGQQTPVNFVFSTTAVTPNR